MSRTQLIAFLKDEEASAAFEYLALIGILGLVWIIAANEYKAKLIQTYAELSRDLSRIRFK